MLRHLGISNTLVQRVASERRYDLRQKFFSEIHCSPEHQDRSMFLFVDEVCTTKEGYQRARAWTPEGMVLKARESLILDERWNTLGCFCSVGGFVGYRHVKDSFKEAGFVKAFQEVVLEHVFDGVSIVIDNAGTHDMALLRTLVSDKGGTLVPLPTYSPDFNPIELAFGLLKRWMVSENWRMQGRSPRDVLDEAFEGCGAKQCADRIVQRCGYGPQI